MDVDIAIVGAGVAGSAAAIELLAQGFTVVLLHREDLRPGLESLSIAAGCALERYGIGLSTPIDTVHARWGSSQLRSARYGGARIVERRALARELRELARKRGALIVEAGRSLELTRPGAWCLEWMQLQPSRAIARFHARHLVDASGRRAVLARMLGPRPQRVDALVAILVQIERPGIAGVWTESVEEGWWNLCSEGERGTATFYSTPQGIRRALADLNAAFGGTHLSKRTRLVDAPAPVVTPCGSQRLSPSAGSGWVAIGDAAWACQPVASAGVAKALRDATLVAPGLEKPDEYDKFQASQFDWYHAELTRQYALERRWLADVFWRSGPTPCPRDATG